VGRATLALGAAVPVLVGIWWFDHVVVAYAFAHPAFASNLFPEATIGNPLWSLGHLALAGAALTLARLAWWSRSAVLGTICLVVGALFALYPWMYENLLADKVRNVPQADVLPAPLASAVRDIGAATFGPLGASVMIGGVISIAGAFVVARLLRDRTQVARSDSPLPDKKRRNLAKLGWPVLALALAAVALATMGWMDSTLNDVQQRGARDSSTFSAASWGSLLSLGARLAVAGLALVLALLAWRARSAVVGVIFAVAGAVFTFLPVIVWNLSSAIARGQSDAGQQAPVLSGPLATMAHDVWAATQGPIHATDMIGGVMVVAGAAVVARSLWLWVAAGDTGNPFPLASPSTQP
jgi:hypothetical protein